MDKTKKNHIDIINKNKNQDFVSRDVFFDFSRKNKRNQSLLVSGGRISRAFFTEDSKLYVTPREKKLLEMGIPLDRRSGKWDSLSSRIIRNYIAYKPSNTSILHRRLKKSYVALQGDIAETSVAISGQFSMLRLWNLSMVGAILFGMFSMTMIYRYLGQGAAANDVGSALIAANEIGVDGVPSVVGTADVKKQEDDSDVFTKQLLEDIKTDKKEDLEKEIREMVKGYPIEDMVSYIAEKDRIVAAFMIGIARKESNWGKRVPVLEGQDCYNYWGYRGIRKLMGTGGHTCFNSRKDAVDTVAKRIQTLVEKEELDTPEKMVIWKCGSNCAVTGGQAAANKWISDVNMIFKEIN